MEANFWIQICTLILMALGIIATLCVSTREMRNSNEKALEQSRNTFFAEYTRRYHDIILAMPDEVFIGTAKASEGVLKYMQLYFNLCSEEYYLHKAKQIPDDIWSKWVDGMRITTKSAVFRTSWIRLGALYDEEFSRFMHHEVFSESIPDNAAK